MNTCEESPKTVSLGDVEEREHVDERVAAVNVAFANLVGMNHGFLEFCPNGEPTEDERLAWVWLIRPRLAPQVFKRLRNTHFAGMLSRHRETGSFW